MIREEYTEYEEMLDEIVEILKNMNPAGSQRR